jgi:hypothetical protein
MAEYEVTDPNGIDYRPVSGGESVHAATGAIVNGDELTAVGREFLIRNDSIRLNELAELERATRDELNAAALDAGVPDPEGLPTKAAVLDAIETMKGAGTNA